MKPKVLLVDCFDSFTFNLKDYLERAGAEVLVITVDEQPKVDFLNSFDGMVLSPGPKRPTDAFFLNQYLKIAIENQLPILGICLGMQAIGEYFGAKLELALQPMHGKTDIVFSLEENCPMLLGCTEPVKVVRYHSLVLKNLPSTLCASLITDEGELMGLRHQNLPIWGFQFHPEAWETDHGVRLLQNWLEVCVH